MSDKSNKTISAKEFKESFISQFKEVGAQLDVFDRYQIAINLHVALETVKRYMDKKSVKEIRNFDLAEKILNEAKSVLATKQATASTV